MSQRVKECEAELEVCQAQRDAAEREMSVMKAAKQVCRDSSHCSLFSLLVHLTACCGAGSVVAVLFPLGLALDPYSPISASHTTSLNCLTAPCAG